MKNKSYSKGAEWRRWDLHLHTKSSYDYKYNGEDADEVLIKALRDNEVCAVAITDHFKIDAKRIAHLNELAPEIVFFPGVELRTDKGANNLHVILIFSEKSNLDELENKFNVIMLGQKAKSVSDNDKVYWDFKDIIEFAQSEDGLVSIHAGKKSSGVDQEIRTASCPYKDAVKDEIATVVDFFDMGKKEDFIDYQKYVFPEIGERPMIICSDNHDARNYNPIESLWIKADCTFDGLKQCIFHPSERVFVGVIPPSLDRVNKNKRNTISNISVKRIPNPIHANLEWFNTEIELNPNLVAVIGNKGSGKSAFSDIIGQLCKCHTMNQASFLSNRRFRNPKTNYSADYEASIMWEDGHKESRTLSDDDSNSVIENAQYLPQAYIEKVCNDIGDEFQKEINRVIFSYVDPVERGTASDLNELVENKTLNNKTQQMLLLNKLRTINADIIKLENKRTTEYNKRINNGLIKLQEDIARHHAIKPVEVKKPDNKEQNEEYQNKLNEINEKIRNLELQKNNCLGKISSLNELIDATNLFITEIMTLGDRVNEIKTNFHQFIKRFKIENLPETINFDSPVEKYKAFLKSIQESRKECYEHLHGTDSEDGLDAQIDSLKVLRAKHIENGDANEKKYQKYLLDLQEWDNQKKLLMGDELTAETLVYYQNEKKYLDDKLEEDYSDLLTERFTVVSELYKLIQALISTYNDIYEPIQNEIKKILSGIEEKIEFEAEIQLTEENFTEKILAYISQRYVGIFKGKVESREKMNQIVNSTSFDSFESVCSMLGQVMEVITEDIDLAEKKVQDRQGFYNYLFALEYIGVDFKLKVGSRELSELSPGERGIVLLIFYLALSKENTPILVDQPEDNLDNQSVFSNLGPCINAAKQKRQVIIVTHNPNIAVACDAEQIIYCEMDKDNYQIKYSSGSIENPITRKHVVDVLEGTMPAFELRRKKYFEKLEHSIN